MYGEIMQLIKTLAVPQMRAGGRDYRQNRAGSGKILCTKSFIGTTPGETGTPVEQGFAYDSGRNTQWLTGDELMEMVEDLGL